MTRYNIPPGDLAKVDQLAAELGAIVRLAARHMRTCRSRPAGVCIGEAATVRISGLGHPRVESVLEEAVAQLARAASSGGATPVEGA